MDCYNCGGETISKNFCVHCGIQLRCKTCGAPIESNINFCGECGTEFQSKNESSRPNTLLFEETSEGRTLNVEFSDTTADTLTKTLGLLFGKQFSDKNRTLEVSQGTDFSQSDIEEAEVEVNDDDQKTTNNTELSKLEAIIRHKNDKYDILKLDLKANNMLEYAQRLTYLNTYREKLMGNAEADRKQLNLLLEKAGVYNGRFRSWIANEQNIINSKLTLELRTGGIESAKQILEEVFNDELKGKWIPGINSNSSNKSSSSKPESYPILKDLKLSGIKGKEDFKSFVSRHQSNSGVKLIALSIYYLQEVLEHGRIGLKEIYTCFAEVKKTPPSSFKKSVRNLGHNPYSYIDASDMTNITMPLRGKNYIENDLVLKDENETA